MKQAVVALRGCAPAPLAHYLKALGIFRLVADQRDPEARGFWRDDVFYLASALDEESLVTFIADQFEPTPMLSPWNGGSGFYPKDNHTAIDAIASSTASRFSNYRAAIALARADVAGRQERPAEGEKDALLGLCQREWAEPALAWFNAAVSRSGEGKGRYPSLLGTGGNDGRLDFTNNLMQRLTELLDVATGQATSTARALAVVALFGGHERGLVSAAIGQFLPGSGGANGTAGYDAATLFNPWDFVLSLEGALALRVAALRKLDAAGATLASAPFALQPLSAGYASAGAEDDVGRGEQWMPLWSGPARYDELKRLFAEGRLLSGTTRPRGALDGARAIAKLGCARGVSGFERYAFMVRNGLSNLAVPLGRVRTRQSPNVDVRLLDELDPWINALRRASEDKHAPQSYGRALQRIERVSLDTSLRDLPSPDDWCTLVTELGATEDILARSARFAARARLRPVPILSARWLEAADDGSVEYRLAASLASACAPSRDGQFDELGPIRAHCLPLDPAKRFLAFASSDDSLRDDPRVVWTGADVVDALAKVVLRRAMESKRAGYAGLALGGVRHASLEDVRDFVLGAVDEARLGRLARGFMCVTPASRGSQAVGRALPLYALFRISNLDASRGARTSLPPGTDARVDPQTLRLLAAGRLDAAVRLALARVGAMGFRPRLRCAAGDARLSLRLLASLAFPIGPAGVRTALDAVTKASEPHETEIR